MAGKVEVDDAWIVDSGEIEHITRNKELLENIISGFLETLVTIPSGETIPMDGKGNCVLKNNIKINKVLHIPKFNCTYF